MWYHTKKSKKTQSLKKRGLATTVQPEPDFSRTYCFHEKLGINKDCLNSKFHYMVRVDFKIWTKNIKNGLKMGVFPNLLPTMIFFKNRALSLLYPYDALTSCKKLEKFS